MSCTDGVFGKGRVEAEPSLWMHHSLYSVMRRMSDAWSRRGEPNVLLVHYEDLSADLEGEMRRIAAFLGIVVPDGEWAGLVRAASFEYMRATADQIQPLGGMLKDNSAFFRSGTSGEGRELLTGEELDRYYSRVAELAPADLLSWLHREHA